MKTLIAKLRISATFDRPAMDRQTGREVATGELKRFEDCCLALDRQLMGGPPSPELPAGLHGSVMRAIRNAAGHSVPRRFYAYRWAVAAACACLLLGGLWNATILLRSRLAASPFSSTASATLNQQMASLPSAVLSPLSREWQSINLDLEKTAEFLLASVP